MNKKVFSVVIVSYKKLDILIDCIKSIQKFNDIGKALEIIVIENSGSMGICKAISNMFKEVTVIKNENRGFGQANNIGAKIARGKYLLFLNPDTIFIEPLFKFAIDKFEKDSNLALFGVKLVDKELNGNMSFYYIDKYGVISNQLLKKNNKKNIYVDGKMYISGADIFIRKNVFIESGMFDENIFMYNEEPDLIKRIKKKCEINKTSYFSEKRLIHLEGKTTELIKNTKLKLEIESYKYYCIKYNLNFRKKINIRKRYELYKMFIYFIFGKKKQALKQKQIYNILSEFCKSK